MGGHYFVSLATHERRPYLSDRHVYVSRAIDSLARLPGVRVEYSRILSDHVQLILSLSSHELALGELIRRLKASTTRRSGIRLWAANFYHRPLPDGAALRRVREYVCQNPFCERIDWDEL